MNIQKSQLIIFKKKKTRKKINRFKQKQQLKNKLRESTVKNQTNKCIHYFIPLSGSKQRCLQFVFADLDIELWFNW